MYEAYWGLQKKPFENTPDPRFFVSIFPLGSLVKLNNGEIGRVVGTSRLHPTRPTVDILLDPRGRKLSQPRMMNLGDEPMLYIVDPAIEEGVLQQASS